MASDGPDIETQELLANIQIDVRIEGVEEFKAQETRSGSACSQAQVTV